MKSFLLFVCLLLAVCGCNSTLSQETDKSSIAANNPNIKQPTSRENVQTESKSEEIKTAPLPKKASTSGAKVITEEEVLCDFSIEDNSDTQLDEGLQIADSINSSVQQRAADRERLMEFLQSQAPASEIFEARDDTLSIVKTKAGTLLYFQPESLETEDGLPINGPIQIEIKELLTTTDFCLANVQTVSDGELLVSGGSYFIKCSVNNKPLRLKEGRHLVMKFSKPQAKGMSIFYGNRTNSGSMNWIPDSQIPSKDTTTRIIRYREPVFKTTHERKKWLVFSWVKENTTITKEWRVKKVGFITEENSEIRKIGQLGWINLDHFSSQPTKRVNLEFAPNSQPMAGTAFFIFRRIKSVVTHDFDTMDKSSLQIRNMPKGHNVRCVILVPNGDKFYSSSSNFIVGKKNPVFSNIEEIKEEDVRKLFRL